LASVSVFLLELENSLAGARIDMPKKKLSRAKMCKEEVLAAIQEYPSCKAVKEVAISEVAADSVWRVTSSIVEASSSKRPTTLYGMLKTSFGNNMS
jgi:uncharacterized protein (DUF342 family)